MSADPGGDKLAGRNSGGSSGPSGSRFVSDLAIKWGKLGAALLSGMLAAFFRGVIAIPLAIQEAVSQPIRALQGFLVAFIDAVFAGQQDAFTQAFNALSARLGNLPGPLQFLVAVLMVGGMFLAFQWVVSRFG